MKIEIELPESLVESEVCAAIVEAARRHIGGKLGYWATENEVKREIDDRWSDTVGRIVQDEMSDLPKLRETIRAALERKLAAQLTKAIKAQDVQREISE